MPTTRFGHCFHGVDYSVPPHELPETALADASNVLPNSSGLPQPRGGSVKYNTTSLASRVTSFFEHKTGSDRNQLVSYSTKVAQYNSASGEFVDRITGLTADKIFQWVNFAGKAIGVNEGFDNPQYFADSSTYGDLAGTPPKGLTIAEWSNRLWFGGNSTDVALLTGSDLNDPTTYTGPAAAADSVSQTVGDSKDPITGLFPYFDTLLVGKLNNIYRVTGDPPTDATSLAIKPLYSKGQDNVGFTSQWGISQIGNDVVFLDGYDIKRLSAVQEYGDVEYASIIPHFRDFIKDEVDKAYLKYTQFFHYKKNQQLWVSIPTGSDTHLVFVLDYRFKSDTGRYSFYPQSAIIASCFGGVEDGEVTNLYYGDETGFVRQLDTGNTDDGAAISSYFTNVISGNNPKYDTLDRHEIRKQFQYADVYISHDGNSLDITPYYAIDLFDAAQVRTSGNYSSLGEEDVSEWNGTGVKNKRIRLFGVSGKTLALKWVHNTASQNYILHPGMVNYSWKSRVSIV